MVRVSNWFRVHGFADVFDDLLIGAYPLDAQDVKMLGWMNVRRVLNLVADEEYRPDEREAVERAYEELGIEEYRLPFIDHGSLPAEELESAVSTVDSWLAAGVRTYLHCRAGWQRSAAVAAGVVALRQGLDIADALAWVRARKPSADPLPHQREDLARWWEWRAAAADPPGAAA